MVSLGLAILRHRPVRGIGTTSDHLEGSLGWASTGVKQDQDAGDDRTVNLYLHTVLLGAQKMATA